MIGVGDSLASSVTLGDYVYCVPSTRFTSKFHVGSFSIIEANAVVTKEVEYFSIVAGIPAKIINKITPDNLDEYLIDYFCVVDKGNPEFIESVKQEFLSEYEKYCPKVHCGSC